MTLYGICLLPVIPMRKTKSDKSEMINQVLFGENFKILRQEIYGSSKIIFGFFTF